MSIIGLVVAAVLALLLLMAIARPFFALPASMDSFRDRQRERALNFWTMTTARAKSAKRNIMLSATYG
jgi:uncharacterized protein HemY